MAAKNLIDSSPSALAQTFVESLTGAIDVRLSIEYGRTYSGIKRLFVPCCIKGKFYANLTLLHKGNILCQPRLAVPKDKLLCQVLWHKNAPV